MPNAHLRFPDLPLSLRYTCRYYRYEYSASPDNEIMAEEVHPTSHDEELVAECLLGWAKDVRYVGMVRSSISEVVEPHLADSVAAPSRLSKKSWFFSCLLYVTMMIGHKGRSLGMHTLGLGAVDRSGRKFSRGRLLCASVLLGVTVAFSDWLTTKENQAEGQSDRLRGNARRRRHELLRRQMLERTAGNGGRPSAALQNSRNSSRATTNEISLRCLFQKRLQRILKVMRTQMTLRWSNC